MGWDGRPPTLPDPPMSAAEDLLSRRPRTFLLLLCAAAYAGTLFYPDFILDDGFILANNELLRRWASLPKLLCTGYWEGALGLGAPVQELRPALMLSYFLTYQLFGPSPWAFHLANLLLHGLNAVLILALLRPVHGERAALCCAALFCVLPVHAEAVAYISGRSELLVSAFLLLAWLSLRGDHPRAGRGLSCFAMALLTKEQAVMFPLLLALQDWALEGKRFWERGRRGLYAGLAACLGAYLLLRITALSAALHAGVDYFGGAGPWVRLPTMARFAWRHYVFPTVSGLGLQADYNRPFFPDSSPSDPLGWLCLSAWIGLLGASAHAFFSRRSRTAFWLLFAFLLLVPTSNLILKLDAVGAQRFLYLPSLALCAVVAASLATASAGLRIAVLGALLGWYLPRAWSHNRAWSSEKLYYQTALRDNPGSSGAKLGLGVALTREGRTEEALALFRQSASSEFPHPAAHYNMGKLHWERGNWEEARRHFLRAAEINPGDPDTLVFLALVAERFGNMRQAEGHYRGALALRPWDLRARFNLGRLHLLLGDPTSARIHWEEFLRLAPLDPDAPEIGKWLSRSRASP